jgi:hypothetical protein
MFALERTISWFCWKEGKQVKENIFLFKVKIKLRRINT